jgi:hypothetical protein
MELILNNNYRPTCPCQFNWVHKGTSLAIPWAKRRGRFDLAGDVVVRCWCRSFVDDRPVENPKRRLWWAQQQVFPQYETKVYRTSRRKNQTSEGWCPLASRQLRTIYIWRLVQGLGLHQQQRGTCTQHNQVLCPNSQWGCQSHRFAANKGLSVSSGQR